MSIRPFARQLFFDTITQPKTDRWSTIIVGYICSNMPHEAFLFYSRMKSCSYLTKHDPYSYSSVLKTCALSHNFHIDGFGRCLARVR
ncbi:hypothetical protein E1A91_A06G157000v1 [Gossypium mustelinum]|uniref:Pentatricopeptide repeat-containing protein n=1 Tax=Gossypium mustelinum TaxID=34275 RepID=A0A5D2YWA8_GOSMU|nr:hypothetical protein E1A91_A06G157000v1 [Gossypium mustelinum]